MMVEKLELIRNFAIIAHIDHGKSTLADRFLEITQTISKDKLINQYLDRLSLERERGITIKMQPVRMLYKDYVLNLIDTPGHVDFSYEVSRALAAVEGAILLIDGTQGIQAQTIAHLQTATRLGLKIIPAINKIDLVPYALPALIKDIKQLLELESEEEIHLISAKLGTGVEELLQAVIEKLPHPRIVTNINTNQHEATHQRQQISDYSCDISANSCSQALIFDSHFDSYKGIIAHIRVFGGTFKASELYLLKSSGFKFKPVEVGFFNPDLEKVEALTAGEIGYIATGIKEAGLVKIGDTIVALAETPALTGYREPQPVVFASIFPSEKITYDYFQANLNKFRLTDPAIEFTPISSPIFGRGYLVGCLGLLHLEILQERLKREFGTEIILTLPSVEYEIILKDADPRGLHAAVCQPANDRHRRVSKNNQRIIVKNPQEWPKENNIQETREPWAEILLVTPMIYLERVLNLVKQSEGIIQSDDRQGSFCLVKAELPIEELITGFYDELKSVSSGYASLEWQFLEYRPADLVKLDILIAEEKTPGLSRIVKRHQAEGVGRNILKELKESLPRKQFAIKLQAAVGSRIIARETIPAMKADVAGYLYGGDRTRKMKLWQKQKRGKKKLAQLGRGRVRVPNEVLMKVLRIK